MQEFLESIKFTANIPILLIGDKIDLRLKNDNLMISAESGQQMAEELSYLLDGNNH